MPKRMTLTIAAASVAACALAACSNTRVITVSEWEAERLQESVAGHIRMYSVGLALLAEATPLCGEAVTATYGVGFVNGHDYPAMSRTAAETVLGTDDRLRALWVASRLPGTGGLMEGDVLVRVGTLEAPRGRGAMQWWGELSQRHLEHGNTLELSVSRAGQEIAIALAPTPVCLYQLELWENDAVYARTTGIEINVTTGLMRFARTDQELAVVLGHEIAHRTAGHVRLRKIGDVAGPITAALFDSVAALLGTHAAGALSHTSAPVDDADAPELTRVEQEMEADYLGLYLMAAAGFDVAGVDEVWRRLDRIAPDSGADEAYQANPTHPTNATRRAAFTAWIAEIARKQAAGQPLAPEPEGWRSWPQAQGEAGTPPGEAETAPGS